VTVKRCCILQRSTAQTDVGKTRIPLSDCVLKAVVRMTNQFHVEQGLFLPTNPSGCMELDQVYEVILLPDTLAVQSLWWSSPHQQWLSSFTRSLIFAARHSAKKSSAVSFCPHIMQRCNLGAASCERHALATSTAAAAALGRWGLALPLWHFSLWMRCT
jgi:hypothetical protein